MAWKLTWLAAWKWGWTCMGRRRCMGRCRCLGDAGCPPGVRERRSRVSAGESGLSPGNRGSRPGAGALSWEESTREQSMHGRLGNSTGLPFKDPEESSARNLSGSFQVPGACSGEGAGGGCYAGTWPREKPGRAPAGNGPERRACREPEERLGSSMHAEEGQPGGGRGSSPVQVVPSLEPGRVGSNTTLTAMRTYALLLLGAFSGS